MLVEAPRQRKIGVNVCATDYDKNGKAATYQPGFAPKKRGQKRRKKKNFKEKKEIISSVFIFYMIFNDYHLHTYK